MNTMKNVTAAVVCSRVLQFRAGPNEYQFHACAEHRPMLEKGDVDLFFATADQPVLDMHEDDADCVSCDFCREG